MNSFVFYNSFILKNNPYLLNNIFLFILAHHFNSYSPKDKFVSIVVLLFLIQAEAAYINGTNVIYGKMIIIGLNFISSSSLLSSKRATLATLLTGPAPNIATKVSIRNILENSSIVRSIFEVNPALRTKMFITG